MLPAETVAAVSAALSQLGKPFAPGTSGPETYDCGGVFDFGHTPTLFRLGEEAADAAIAALRPARPLAA